MPFPTGCDRSNRSPRPTVGMLASPNTGAEVDIDAVIAEHGWALQAVLADGPGAPSFTYTIGLFDRLPELLCVGPSPGVAGSTLNALAQHLRAHPHLARAGQRIELPDRDPVLPVVELGAVAPRWHELYVGQPIAHHGRDDLEVLQVLAPDEAGRFPDDPAVDPRSLTAQPVLADPDRPWRLPHGLWSFELLADASQAILLPIVDGGSPVGREELVPALQTGTGWRLIEQPSLADWCTVGDEVAATPIDEVIPGAEDVEVLRYERVVRRSSRMALRWSTCFHSDEDVGELLRILDRPRLRDDVTVGFGAAPHALTFAVPPRLAEPLRIALRPLERDGSLVPRGLFHQREDTDLAVPDPDCPDCRSRS
jgi:hypothetical protein